MDVRWLTVFLDRPGPSFDAATAFWLAVTGARRSPARGEHGEFVTLLPPDGDAFLRVQRVAEGPGGCHLDLHVADLAATADRAVELGARPVLELDDVVVLRSPAGLPWCVVGHDGGSTRPGPVGDQGARTIVDQLCIDIPPATYDVECRFWSDLTGWEHRPALLPGYSYLIRPDGLPVRLLFQRRHEAPDGAPAEAHLDLACDDVPVAVAHHEALGARVVARRRHWTTMTDPAGLAYCLTVRRPDTGTIARG